MLSTLLWAVFQMCDEAHHILQLAKLAKTFPHLRQLLCGTPGLRKAHALKIFGVWFTSEAVEIEM